MRTRLLLVAVITLMTIPFAAVAQDMGNDRREVLALSRRIDQLISSRFKEGGVKPAAPAVDATYFRRLSLDLAGRIPPLDGLRDYLEQHCFTEYEVAVWPTEAPRIIAQSLPPLGFGALSNGSYLFALKTQDIANKRWEWTEKLLAQDTYGKHFASVMRSLILQGSQNQQVQFFQLALENWLQEHLQRNTPYSRIAKEILVSSPNNPNRFNPNDARAASPAAFYVAGENKPENLAASTTRMFLGVKLECAQCHAHPFAKWTKNQFWEFAAFFSGIQAGGRPGEPAAVQQVVLRGREITIPGTDKKVKAKFLNGQDPVWAEGVDSRATLADWIISKDNPFFAKAAVDHLWTYFFGISLFEPILEPSDDTPVTHPQLLDELAQAFVDHNFDLKFIIRAIVHTEAYARSTEGRKEDVRPEDYYFFSRMPVRGLSPEQIYDSVVEAVQYKSTIVSEPSRPFQMNNSPRAEFVAKYTSQEKRNEMQTSILQALFLMNGKFLNEQIQLKNSKPLETLTNPDYPGGNLRRVDTIFVMILGRQPRQDEADRFVRYLDRRSADGKLGDGLSDILWVLLNSAEFLLNH